MSTRRISQPKKLAAGLIYLVFGVVIFIAALNYSIGSALDMGPGYFPAALGLILVGIGIAAVIQSAAATTYQPLAMPRIEPIIMVLASIISFALLIERAGLVVATCVCLFFACFRRVFSNPLEFLAILVCLLGFSIVVFIYIFQLNIPLFWWDS